MYVNDGKKINIQQRRFYSVKFAFMVMSDEYKDSI